ncbi:MAG TPA: cyclopropane fatty acyl phospholipid synthase [Saprospiraceae bacterium]|nr:cyclopropane fatty acyl phospholipid synthase [Saprospiraceae bacterium]
MEPRKLLSRAFAEAHIEIGRDIVVKDDRFYSRVLRGHSLGMGESYVEGWWDAPDLTGLFCKIISGLPGIRKYLKSNVRRTFSILLASMTNRQQRRKARRDVQSHYDIDQALYETMLDENMVYSSAYFQSPAWTLGQAQEAKIDLIYQKLHLPEHESNGQQPKVLDIGCGWGYALEYGARHYAIEGVGITLSENQLDLARQHVYGLPVEIRLQDYRDLPEDEKYDAIFSIGMLEHVGQKNYRAFMRAVSRHLKPNGLFLLHTIGSTKPGSLDSWMNKYIFPGAYIPSLSQIARASQGVLIAQDFHNFGLYYARTLEEWYARFLKGWNQLQEIRPEFYNERFFRMWKYYLLTCAASFFTGYNELWQIVYSKQPLDKVYESVRSPRRIPQAHENQVLIR